MPEGPEIRFHREQLQSIVGKSITNIKALSRKRVYIPNKSKIRAVNCKGKLLWIETVNYVVHIHFGLTGWIYIDEEPDYTKYIISLSNGQTIYVDSMRKFTKMRVYKKNTHKRLIENLGIDILTGEFTLDAFEELVCDYNMMISKFLLDQDKLSGIGNYIRNEALYIAKIHPKTITSKLSDKDIKSLYNAIKYVSFSLLIAWLKNNKIKISKDIRKVTPKKIQYPYRFKVYEKERDPSGNKVTLENIAGRKTYYVKSRQKLNK